MNVRILTTLGVTAALALVAFATNPSTAPLQKNARGFRSPIRLAQANDGHLLVADYYQRRIVHCGRDGQYELGSFTIDGRPLAVESWRGRILVGNETAQRVEVYDRGGNKLFDFGGVDGDFLKPTDIAIDRDRGLVFVVDGLDAKVKIFSVADDERGVLVGTIPPSSSPTNSLIHPTGIAVDSATSRVFVSDFGDPNLFRAPSVHCFDYKGNLTNTISGSTGLLGERFSRPQGLQVRGDAIFLVDSWMGQIFVLERTTGLGLGQLGGHGAGPGQLNLPLDIVLDGRSDDVFVTDYQNKRVAVFPDGAQLP